MLNDIFRSFFRTLGRIIAYLFVGYLLMLLFGQLSAKANSLKIYLDSLTYNSSNLLIDKYYSSGNGNRTINFGYLLDDIVYNKWLYNSFVICTDATYSSSYIPSSYSSYMKNLSISKTNYSCSFSNSSYSGGKVVIMNFMTYIGAESGGDFTGSFVVYQDQSASYQLIDFVVNSNNFVNSVDYSSQTAINQNSQIINQNTTIINQNNQQLQEQQETNDKLDDINDSINSDSDDTTSGSCGIICKLKGIFTGIVELPVKLVNLLIDALKSLFIPEDTDFITNFVDSIESKLGFIAEVPVQIIKFGINLSSAGWEEVTSVSLPAISIFGYNFWSSQEVDISEGLKVFQTFRYITDCLCVIICARGLKKLWENFTGGDNS